MCQLAVPLILPRHEKLVRGHRPVLLSWSLQTVVKTWRQQGSADVSEKNIVNVKMPLVSCISLGPFSNSKSKVLNQLLSTQYHQHNVFWCNELTEGEADPVLSDGLVETAWYLPGGDTHDTFPSPVAFVNVRGDGLREESSSKFIAKNSSLICLFMEQITQEVVNFVSNCDIRKLLLTIVHRNDYEDGLQELLEKVKLKNEQIILLNEGEYACRKVTSVVRKTVLERMKYESLRLFIINNLKDAAAKENIKIDENSTKCRKAKEASDEILSRVTQRNILEAKEEILPRQGQMWRQWSTNDKEQYRQEQRRKTEPMDTYIKTRQEEKKQCRKEQWRKDTAPELTLFLQKLLTLDKETRKYFLKWFQIGLDAHSRDELNKIWKEYRDRAKRPVSPERTKELEQLDKQLQEGSLGLEHFFREFAQIYEACADLQEITADKDKLPGIMAELLVDGYPLEIMDGDVAYVPEVWVKAVLEKVQDRKRSPLRLYVVSTLGVQSSGKSNTMFNLHFPVSSSRCTRGAFLQLIKAPDSETNYDFLAVIDTEGLKSPEMMSLLRSYEHNNELATLVIGLSDVTIVNLAMQSTADMKDTLQVAVHAFLRMKCVGQKQACYFVHQNVPSIGATSENVQAHQNLIKQLDAMTYRAAELEGRHQTYKTFSDILQYDPLEHCFYVPGLWMGNPPMAATSIGYCTEVEKVKDVILQHASSVARHKEFFSVQGFGQRLHDLWRAMKYEDFVFSFQNCLAAEAYGKLKKTFSDLKHGSMTRMNDWKTRMKIQIECTSPDMLQTVMAATTQKAHVLVDDEKIKMKKLIEEFIKKSENKEFVMGYKSDVFKEIDNFTAEMEKNILSILRQDADLRMVTAKLKGQQKEIEERLKREVQKYLNTKDLKETHQGKCLSDDQKMEMKMEFDAIWNKSVGDVNVDLLSFAKDVDIDTDVYQILCEYFEDQKHLITKTLIQNEEPINLSKLQGKFETRPELLVVKEDVVMLDHPDAKTITSGDLQRAQQAAGKVYDLALATVRRKTVRPGPYETHAANAVIKLIHDRVTSLQDGYFLYSIEFKVELAVRAAASVARAFIKAHKKFMEEDHPIRKVEAAKESYFQLFESLILQTGQAELFCKNFLSAALLSNIRRSFDPDTLANEVRSVGGQSMMTHEFLQLSMMIELAHTDSFKEYWTYINDYKKYVLRWLKRETESVFSKVHPYSSRSRLCEIGVRRLETLLDSVEISLLEAQTRCKDSFPDFISEFIRILQSEKNIMMFDMAEVDRYQGLLRISDIDNFVKVSREILHEDLRETLTSKICAWDIRNELNRLVPSVEEILFDLIVGCSSCCPFCKAPCDCHSLAKLGDHSVTIHRPRGLMGATWSKTSVLIAENCPYLLNSKTDFKNDDTNDEWVPYRNYKTYYSDWSITPSADSRTAIYWKWVFARFQKEFAKCYGVQPNMTDVPADWYTFSWEDLENDLNEIYNIKVTTL